MTLYLIFLLLGPNLGVFLGRAIPPKNPEDLVPWKTAKFGPNNCLTNNFLHCEFQLSFHL